MPVLPDVDNVEEKEIEPATVAEPEEGDVERDVEITVRVKLQVPISPSGSDVVPEAEYEPTAKLPLVVTTPLEETTTLGAPLLWT